MNLKDQFIVEEVFPRVVQVLSKGKLQFPISMMLMRVQEFYESPDEDIRKKYFQHGRYMEKYAERHGKGGFTYFEDWEGFNVPGNYFKTFFKLFRRKSDWTEHEELLYEIVKPYMDKYGERFYVIGMPEHARMFTPETFFHELAHGFYYIDEEYREGCESIENDLTKSERKILLDGLRKLKYHDAVLSDELQAYCSTDNMSDIPDTFDCEYEDVPWHIVYEFQKHFKEYMKELLDGEDDGEDED